MGLCGPCIAGDHRAWHCLGLGTHHQEPTIGTSVHHGTSVTSRYGFKVSLIRGDLSQ